MFLKKIKNYFILGFIAFGVFYFFRPPFIGDWDEFVYVYDNIIHHKFTVLCSGRIGYFWICMPIWDFFHFLKVPTSEAWRIISGISLLGGIGLIIVFYKFCKNLTNEKTAFLSSLFLIFSPAVIIYSGACMSDIPATFFLYAGLMLFYICIKREKRYLYLLSGAIAGFAVQMREQTLFFIPLFFYLSFVDGKINKRLRGILLFFTTYIIFAAIGHLLFPELYLTYIAEKLPAFYSNSSIKFLIKKIVSTGYQLNIYYTIIPLLLAALELLFTIFKERNYRKLWLIIFWMIIPVLPLIPIELYPVRYYIFIFPALAYLSASAVTRLFSNWKSALIIVLLINTTGFGVIHKQPSNLTDLFVYRNPPAGITHFTYLLKTRNKELTYEKEYGNYLYKNFPENSVFITGTYVFLTSLYYQQTGIRPNWITLPPWLTNSEIITKTKYYLRMDRPVFIDTELVNFFLNSNNTNFLNEFENNFSLKEVILPDRKEINTIYQVFLKNKCE
ncbi:MAG: glycosyltransferase family 39 protein [bacterium]|nr:glycosyltransferase family 39 protein [bacterium]